MIVVTAVSFMRDRQLRSRLEATFPRRTIVYLEPNQIIDHDSLLRNLKGAEAWLIGRERADFSLLNSLVGLKVIAKYGVGLDNIDIEACRQLGIGLAWEAGVNRDAVAEHSLGLMLSLCRNIGIGSRRLSQGVWWKNGGHSMYGRTVGIVGFGHVGTRLSELLQIFSCRILFHDIISKVEEAVRLKATQATYREVLQQSDFLSFHVPLTNQTHRMFGEAELALVKPSAYIINTSRGEVIDESALKRALQKNHIAGAALDVFSQEPLKDKDLYLLDNFIGTAHTAGNSQEAIWAMGEAAIRGLQKVLG